MARKWAGASAARSVLLKDALKAALSAAVRGIERVGETAVTSVALLEHQWAAKLVVELAVELVGLLVEM